MKINIEKSVKILKWQPKFSIFKSIKVTIDLKKVLSNENNAEEITKKQINEYMNEFK